MEERYIAAVEISSSKIIGTVGRTRGDGSLDVIAVEQERNVESVRYGIIQNLEETSLGIARILHHLEQKPGVNPRKIDSVFVGLSGRSLRSINTEVRITLPDDTEINDEILRRLRDQAWSSAVDSSLEVVDAVPRVYYVGKTETRSPKGMMGNSIRAIYDLVVCRPELRRNIERVVNDKLHLRVSGFIVTALAAGHLVLSDDEKRLGCMLVDFGAETTTVTIYRNGNLCYYATLPLGSRNITRDIQSLNLVEKQAEEIKIKSGNAIASDTPSTLNLNGLRLDDVANLIVARAEEIVANVIEQISYAGLKTSELPGGIVCMGGGFKLNGMAELLNRQTGLPVKRAAIPSYVRIEDVKAPATETMEAISILYAAATHSLESNLSMPEKQELPPMGEPNPDEVEEQAAEEKKPKKPKGPSPWEKLTQKITNFFTDDSDDSDLV